MKQACATNEPFCLIINTGDKDTIGEHWTALYHGSTSRGSKYVDYIDPFASLPYKKGTLDLIKTCGQEWTCNLEPVQDMLDSKANEICQQMKIAKIKYHMRDNFKANDALVTVLCENMLFNNNNANRINV